MPAPVNWRSDFLLDNNAPEGERLPWVTASPDGRFVINFTEQVAPGDENVLTYFASSNGDFDGILAMSNAAGIDERMSSSAFLTNGLQVIVWTEKPNGGGSLDVYYRVRSPGGTEVVPRTIVKSGAGDQADPVVAALGDGTFVIALNDSASQIVLRRYNEFGTFLNETAPVNSTTPANHPGDLRDVSIAALPNNNNTFVVAWTDTAQVTRARVYYANASAATPEFVIEGSAALDAAPDIAGLANGGFVAIAMRNDATIVGRFYSDSGVASPQLFTIAANADYSSANKPDVAALSDGRFVVVWVNNSGDIEGQIFFADGAPDGTSFIVNAETAGEQSHPSLAVLEDGRFVVSWESEGSPPRIFSAIYDPREAGLNTSASDLNDEWYGTNFTDVVYLGAGQDNFYSGDAIDYVYAEDGADDVYGGNGNDRLYGGNGNDTLYGEADADVLQGGNGNDLLLGGSLAGVTDTGDIWLSGEAGDDTVYGVLGNDRIDGGAGNDTLFGDQDSDYVTGGSGNDTIYGGDGGAFAGDTGDQWLGGDAGDDTIRGDEGNDRIDGGVGNDVLYGNKGADYITGGAGNDYLYGGDAGASTGDSGDTWLGGDAGADIIHGNLGNDRIDGGADNDVLHGDDGADYITGGAGDEFIYGGDGGANAGDIADTWLGGDAGNDTILGGNGNDRIDGGADDDVLLGEEDADYITGGTGNDIIYGGDGGANGGDTGDAWLGGDAGNDRIYGNLGNDRIDGGANDDVLAGGQGNDTLTGGTGADVFLFESASDGGDTIGDWTAGLDKIRIDASNFGGGLAGGPLAANRLIVGASPVADQAFGQFLFNATSGSLYWDADGVGAGAAVFLCRMNTPSNAVVTTLSVTDFEIVP